MWFTSNKLRRQGLARRQRYVYFGPFSRNVKHTLSGHWSRYANSTLQRLSCFNLNKSIKSAEFYSSHGLMCALPLFPRSLSAIWTWPCAAAGPFIDRDRSVSCAALTRFLVFLGCKFNTEERKLGLWIILSTCVWWWLWGITVRRVHGRTDWILILIYFVVYLSKKNNKYTHHTIKPLISVWMCAKM